MPLYNWKREEVGSTVLAGGVFNVEVRKDLLYRVVRWQLAKRQQGTHKTKTRSDARGGGRKPWKQKGTGRARAGTIRAPHWRGGGVAHGPLPRSHAHDLQRKVRRQGLACALSAKAAEGRLLVLDSLSLPDGKTRLLDEALDILLADEPRRSVLFIDSGKTAADGGLVIRRAAANLPWVDVLPQEGANVYSILQRDMLVLTQGAAAAVAARTLAPVHRTPARLRQGPEPVPVLHPAVREKLAARAALKEKLAARAASKASSI